MAKPGSYGEWVKWEEQKKKSRKEELAYQDAVLKQHEDKAKELERQRAEAESINNTLNSTVSLEKKLNKELRSGKDLKEKVASITSLTIKASKTLLAQEKMTEDQFKSQVAIMEELHDGTVDLDRLASIYRENQLDTNDALSESQELLKGYLDVQRDLLIVEAKQAELLSAADDLTGGMVSGAKGAYEQFQAGYGSLALWGIAIGAAVAILTSFSSNLDEIGNTFGTLGVTEFSSSLMSADAEMMKLGFDTGAAGESAMELSNNFGMAFGQAVQLAPTAAEMAKSMGMSVTEASALLGTLTEIGGLTPQQAEDLTKSAEQLAVAEGVAPGQVMKEVGANTEVFAKFAKDGGKNILGAAIQAKKLGTDLETVAGISDGLLDFQSSLEKEIEASVMLGRQLNFQKARELALNNDIEGAMSAVVDQLGSEAEFNEMNALQRKALADSIGVSVDQMAKFVGKQDEAKSLGDQIGAQKGFEELAGEDAISALSSITFELKSLGAELAKTFGPILNIALKGLSLLIKPISALVRFFTEFGTAAKITSGVLGFLFLPQLLKTVAASWEFVKAQGRKLTSIFAEEGATKSLTIRQAVMNQLRSVGNVLTGKSTIFSDAKAAATLKETAAQQAENTAETSSNVIKKQSLSLKLKNIATTIKETAGKLYSNTVTKASNLLRTMSNKITQSSIVVSMKSAAARTFEATKELAYNVVRGAGNALLLAYNTIKQSSILLSIKYAALTAYETVKETALNIVLGIKNAITMAGNTLKTTSIALSMKSAAASAISAAKSGIEATANIVRAITGFFAGAAAGSGATLGFGAPALIAMAVAGVAAMLAAVAAAPRFDKLPSGKQADVKSGIAIADAGESIAHTKDMEGGGGLNLTPVVDAINILNQEIVTLRSDMNSYLGMSGTAVKGIGSEVVSAINRSGT